MSACSRICRQISAILLTIMCVFSLSSCAGDKNGKKHLLEVMFEDYVAEVDFLLDVEGVSVSGTARITKNDNVRIELLSPDPYTGISVQGDAGDKASVLSIEYSGIRADIPKNAVHKLSIMLSMFSDAAVTNIGKQSGNDFKLSAGEYVLAGFDKINPYEVSFVKGETEYIYIYDSISGIPLNIYAKSGATALQVKIKKFKAIE